MGVYALGEVGSHVVGVDADARRGLLLHGQQLLLQALLRETAVHASSTLGPGTPAQPTAQNTYRTSTSTRLAPFTHVGRTRCRLPR